jgi:hypothetical protein
LNECLIARLPECASPLRTLQESFQDLMSIFAHYAKSIGGSTTAEDAVEMTLSEFKVRSHPNMAHTPTS